MAKPKAAVNDHDLNVQKTWRKAAVNDHDLTCEEKVEKSEAAVDDRDRDRTT